jgi:IS605 OrfB family transposase
MDEIREIALRYAKVKEECFRLFGSVEGLKYLSYPRKVRDQWVKDKKVFNLQARYWKSAFEETFSNIKTTWMSKFTNIRSNASKFNKEERHFINYILCSYPLVYNVIKGIPFEIDKFKNLDTKNKLTKWLRRQLRREFNKPHQKKHRSFMLDTDMYSFFNHKDKLWISIMSLTFWKRINIPLTSKIHYDKNVKIVINNNRVEIHEAHEMEQKAPPLDEKIIGIDKGLTPMVHTNEDKKYGVDLGEYSYKESDRLTEKNKQRAKIKAVLKRHEEKGNFKKVNKIKKHNLGKIKYNHNKFKNKHRIENYINRELNEFFEAEKPSEVVMENLNFSGGKKYSKKMNRRLSSWMKGVIKNRLGFKCLQNSVLDSYVNPAYTSQLCFCGSLNTKRSGSTVHCLDCGRVVDANYLGACNVKARLKDPDIHIFTPFKEVKRILLERYNKKAVVHCANPDLSSDHPLDEQINQEQINQNVL